MLDWQKKLLEEAGLPADLNSIVGRQVRCDFEPKDGDAQEPVTHTVTGVIFYQWERGGTYDGIQFVVKAPTDQVIYNEAERLARPYLSFTGMWGWSFSDIVRLPRPEDRTLPYTCVGWTERLLRQVTWL